MTTHDVPCPIPGVEISETAFRPWLFALDRDGAKREALNPSLKELPYWTVGTTNGVGPKPRTSGTTGRNLHARLAEAALMEDWKEANRLWAELVRAAVMENVVVLRREDPELPPLDAIADAEEIVLAHIRTEQPHLLVDEPG